MEILDVYKTTLLKHQNILSVLYHFFNQGI